MFVRRNGFLDLIMFSPDGNGGDAADAAAAAAQGGAADAATTNQGLASLLAKHENSALAVAELLHGDNFSLREKNRQLTAQLDGAVILRGDEKAAWESYKVLGAPAELSTKLRRLELDRIAGRAGYNPDVFADLDRMAGGQLQYEVKNETVDGKQVEKVFVKDGADSQAQPIADYAAAKWANYLPALKPADSTQQNGGGSGAGLRFPAQHPGGGGTVTESDAVTKFIEAQQAKAAASKNPLLKK